MQIFKNNLKAVFWIKILIIFVIAVAGMFACNKITDSYYSSNLFGAYTDKIETLKKSGSNKTLFVGGSSVLLGVNAEYYEKLSNRPAVNMGLQAVKLYDIYLACIEPYIKEGDTVVLAFEYYPYNYKWENYNDEGLNIAHCSNLYYKLVGYKYRGTYEYQQFLRAYSKPYEMFYKCNIQTRLKGEEKTYLRKNMNSYGDIKKGFNSSNMDPESGDIDFTFNDDTAVRVLEYIERYEEKGAKVYITFPPLYTKKNADDIKSETEVFKNKLVKHFGNRVVGEPMDWVFFDDSKFSDTYYHLNYDAAMEHTEYYFKVINSVKQ